MSDTAALAICGVFVAIGLYNAWRAWHWTEIPEVLEGREHMIPVQIPGVIFFATGPVFFGLEALAGHPANGSPLAVVVGSVAAAIALTGLVLAATTYFLGRPRRLIAPIVRDPPSRVRGPAERARDRRGRQWRRRRKGTTVVSAGGKWGTEKIRRSRDRLG